MKRSKQDKKRVVGYIIWRVLFYLMVTFGIVAAGVKWMGLGAAPVISGLYGPAQGAAGLYSVQAGELKNGFISGETFTNKRVEYLQVEDMALVEGDILLDIHPFQPDQMGVGVNRQSRRWPDGIIPYGISPSLPNQFRITDAIAHWERNSSIRFVERTAANRGQYPNYIYFQPAPGCSSYVGMMGGGQPINLALGCDTGATIHEIGHAIGLWHEQSRADRDEFITVHYENIIPGIVFNFDQHITDGDDIGLYDYDSIMHYPRWAFTKNGKDTITPKVANQAIGETKILSPGDIAAVEEMYEGIIVTAR